MSVESDEDRLNFFSPDEFGGKALYSPKTGEEPYEVMGIFDEPYSSFDPNRWPGHEYQMQQGAHISSTVPTFHCRSADLMRGGKKGDKLEIQGKIYRVEDPKPDGTGLVVLSLREA